MIGIRYYRAEKVAQQAQDEAARAEMLYEYKLDSLMRLMRADSMAYDALRRANQGIAKSVDKLRRTNESTIRNLFTLPVDSLLDKWAALEHRLDSVWASRRGEVIHYPGPSGY